MRTFLLACLLSGSVLSFRVHISGAPARSYWLALGSRVILINVFPAADKSTVKYKLPPEADTVLYSAREKFQIVETNFFNRRQTMPAGKNLKTLASIFPHIVSISLDPASVIRYDSVMKDSSEGHWQQVIFPDSSLTYFGKNNKYFSSDTIRCYFYEAPLSKECKLIYGSVVASEDYKIEKETIKIDRAYDVWWFVSKKD